ncbi:hypothetical protein [Sphingomonas sp. MS122]|uniref:hypothetical protein n=1 Tax=Sphingomonas sp. MS122 TaxID=3412683 RepID=UPI003C2AD7E0
MRYSALTALAGAALIVTAAPALAQTAAPSEAGRLAEQWRVAKRAELLRRQASLVAEIAALDKGATPDTLAAAAAQEEKNARAEPPEKKDDDKSEGKKPEEKKEDGKQKFGGIEFGVGVSFTADLGSRDRIGEAMLDPNGIVRVKDENNGRARIMLESHYFFTPCGRVFGINGLGRNECTIENGRVKSRAPASWGIGPFVALQPGDENVIEAIGMGFMIGFRKNPETTQSFNFGIGYVVDPNTRVLGDGVLQDQPLPVGETEIRYKETAQSGLLFLASFSF